MFSNTPFLNSLEISDYLWNQNIAFEENSNTVLKKDWVRRFKKFANNYLKNDFKQTSYLLKDVYLLHKWNKVNKTLKPVDWINANIKPTYTEIDTTGAQSCAGGACELNF